MGVQSLRIPFAPGLEEDGSRRERGHALFGELARKIGLCHQYIRWEKSFYLQLAPRLFTCQKAYYEIGQSRMHHIQQFVEYKFLII